MDRKAFIEGFYSAKSIIAESQTVWIKQQNLPKEIENMFMKIVEIAESATVRDTKKEGSALEE